MRDRSRPNDVPRTPSSVLAYDIETTAPTTSDGSFPPWPSHRPIAIGFAQADYRHNKWSFDIDALVVGGEVDEAAMLVEADRRMASAAVTCGYNSRGFDALVLRLTAQRLRLWTLPSLAKHAATPRYDASHADLADLYASYGRKVALAEICREISIPIKTSVSGADVGELWEAGEVERIRDYVMEDAVATLILYFAWVAGRMADEALISRPLAAMARHIEATPRLASLAPFVDCALTRWARPRAMAADISAALARLTIKLGHEENERSFT